MFTGIIVGRGKLIEAKIFPGASQIQIELPEQGELDLQIGASVSVDGVCLTATHIHGRLVTFDVMKETLSRTSFKQFTPGQYVNIERAARDGAEIGGHPISGHVDSTVEVVAIETPENNFVMTVKFPNDCSKYIFPKGYVLLNGASLTVCNVNKIANTLEMWLISETLRLTTFGLKKVGDLINLEIERGTQLAVDTMRNFLEERLGRYLPAFEAALETAGFSVDQLAGPAAPALPTPRTA